MRTILNTSAGVFVLIQINNEEFMFSLVTKPIDVEPIN